LFFQGYAIRSIVKGIIITPMKFTKSSKAWMRNAAILLLALIAVGIGIYVRVSQQKNRIPQVPNIEVKLGDFVDYVELRGEIAVGSSNVISAPYNTGDLQLLKLVLNGTPVKKGDVVVQFDATSLQRNADQYRAILKQVEAEIARTQAQQRLAEEQIRTDEMSAKFGLERAQLDASTKDVIPAIENEKNVLAVAKAEQRLSELEVKIRSNRVGAEADLSGSLRKKAKAQADLDQAERNLAALVLTSPGDGIISLLPNSRARTNILGGSSPVFKEGDRAWAGAAIAELPDMATIYASAPVYEADRGRVETGQPVVMRIEAVPDRDHKGRVGEISPLARTDDSSYPPRKSFDLRVQLEQPDSRLRAGMTALMRVEVERISNALVIPSNAVFEKGGRLVVYIWTKDGYRERVINLARRGGSQVMIASGLKTGERIATKDPTIKEALD
jgi:HlyD family secretion protein